MSLSVWKRVGGNEWHRSIRSATRFTPRPARRSVAKLDKDPPRLAGEGPTFRPGVATANAQAFRESSAVLSPLREAPRFQSGLCLSPPCQSRPMLADLER
jgi:hypothetical protein